MKKVLPLLLLWLACSGCFLTPAPVQQARQQRTAAYAEYAANNSKILDFVIEQYRMAEYARIEALLLQDFEATKKLPSAADAVAKMIELDGKRIIAKGAVDAQIVKLCGSVAKAQTDLAIAAKLDEAIAAYENAGIDASVISGAADTILGILKQNMGGK